MDCDIVKYLKNKLEGVSGNIGDEIYNILRNEQEKQLFNLALLANDDYYESVIPRGFCLLFSALACKQKLYVSVCNKRRRNGNCSIYDIRKRGVSSFEPRKVLYDISIRKKADEADNKAKQEKKSTKNVISKVKDKIAQEEEKQNTIAKENRNDLTEFIEFILKTNEEKKIILYDAATKLETMKYLIMHGIDEVRSTAWLAVDEFEGILKLCGLQYDYAFFSARRPVGETFEGSDDEQRKASEDREINRYFMEICEDQGYLWLMYHYCQAFTFPAIAKRIQSSTTVVYQNCHSWLQPNVTLDELDEVFDELVTLVYDVYTNRNSNISFHSKVANKINMERGVVITEEFVAR